MAAWQLQAATSARLLPGDCSEVVEKAANCRMSQFEERTVRISRITDQEPLPEGRNLNALAARSAAVAALTPPKKLPIPTTHDY